MEHLWRLPMAKGKMPMKGKMPAKGQKCPTCGKMM
jgi:hypothetical protein